MGLERIYVAGHRGLVGSAVVRAMSAEGHPSPLTRTRAELDLRNQRNVQEFFAREKPDAVILAAAKVGGIKANSSLKWEFLYENLQIEANVIGAALESGVERFIFLGSSCIYPKSAAQPMSEAALLTGPLEPTNEPYAIAKIAGLKMIESAAAQFQRNWVSLMPTNLYGPHDRFDPEASHVIPSMIRKFNDAKASSKGDGAQKMTLWGTGAPLREFLHVDDLARAILFLLGNAITGLFNVGSGEEIAIRELAQMVASTVGYDGEIEWDTTVADGTPRKFLDSSRMLALGWSPKIGLSEGLPSTYAWYLANAHRE